ncbi:MAG: DUF853 domain-containing protein [Lachnospiraceae bacterium]|nr:DUF853 domain-containing protein [Lachnospiraceae bacterium]
MIKDGKIWFANSDGGEALVLSPGMANRHGLIAGATGTGKTVTLKVLAESFSELGVPVFMADVKGDLAGMCESGEESDSLRERISRFGLDGAGFAFEKYPVTFWDIYGKKGIQLRTTISEMGPLLLSRILGLNDLQSALLSIVFKIADDEGLLLLDTKDLKAMLNYVAENNSLYAADYGNISKVSIAAIVRALVSLELIGGDMFFGEPAFDIRDFLSADTDGKGMIHILDSESLIGNGMLYSTFLLWLLSELFELLPEVGDTEKPKLVFFFDEAHLLFHDAPKALTDKVEQVVKLIRSKGVGIYFCTQNPRDIPDGVLSQLGNKIEHALHAYTPADQKAVRAAAEAFRENPAFDTYETIMALGTGEAVISLLGEDGVPGVVEKASILPPKSLMSSIGEVKREGVIKDSCFYLKYAEAVDPDSAYELLKRKGIEEAEAAEAAKAEEERRRQEEKEEAARQKAEEKEEAARQKAAQKEEAARQKAEERKKEQEAKANKRAVKSVGNTVAGTVGREVGKSVGSGFGKFGKTLGGNLGASLGRGILNTLFKI